MTEKQIVWYILPREVKIDSDTQSVTNLYKSKYLLTDEFEFFLDPYDEGDGYEMSAVARDKCRFVCFFKEFGGHIGLEINQKGCVQVSYEDDINIQVAKKEFESKAFDDI